MHLAQHLRLEASLMLTCDCHLNAMKGIKGLGMTCVLFIGLNKKLNIFMALPFHVPFPSMPLVCLQQTGPY